MSYQDEVAEDVIMEDVIDDEVVEDEPPKTEQRNACKLLHHEFKADPSRLMTIQLQS